MPRRQTNLFVRRKTAIPSAEPRRDLPSSSPLPCVEAENISDDVQVRPPTHQTRSGSRQPTQPTQAVHTRPQAPQAVGRSPCTSPPKPQRAVTSSIITEYAGSSVWSCVCSGTAHPRWGVERGGITSFWRMWSVQFPPVRAPVMGSRISAHSPSPLPLPPLLTNATFRFFPPPD